MRFVSILFFSLSLTSAANSTYTTSCTLCASASELAKMELRLYTGPTTANYTSVLIEDALDLLPKINNSKSTILYIFGWIGSPELSATQVILEACLTRDDRNILLLNWENIAFTLYDFAVRSSEDIGYTLANILNNLVASGLNTTDLNLVGHSLGAQICGYTGRYVNFTLSRITGLDPAGPAFNMVEDHLNSANAEFVEIIHTDIGVFGISLQTGHADFYVNGGAGVQPGCWFKIDPCSHFRAVYVFAESVKNESSLIGIVCDSNANFEAGLCSSNATAVMGYGTPNTARGKYYLQTNSDSPYGRGKYGTTYKTPDFLNGFLVNLFG